MDRVIHIQVEAINEGGYRATCQELPALVAREESAFKVLERAFEMARTMIEDPDWGDYTVVIEPFTIRL